MTNCLQQEQGVMDGDVSQDDFVEIVDLFKSILHTKDKKLTYSPLCVLLLNRKFFLARFPSIEKEDYMIESPRFETFKEASKALQSGSFPYVITKRNIEIYQQHEAYMRERRKNEKKKKTESQGS